MLAMKSASLASIVVAQPPLASSRAYAAREPRRSCTDFTEVVKAMSEDGTTMVCSRCGAGFG